MSMKEKVARAAYEAMLTTWVETAPAAIEGNAFLRGDWDAQPKSLRDNWIIAAEAAILAMRDYTEAMSLAGGAVDLIQFIPSGAIGQSAAERCWLAMCDAALKDTE